MVFGYARVNMRTQTKNENSLEAQIAALRAAGAEKLYIDIFTGTKMDCLEFRKMQGQLRRGDSVIVTKLDQLARSVSQVSGLIIDMIDKGIEINVLNLGKLSDDSINRLMRNVLLSFAQFERNMIVQRTSEGRDIARAINPDYREGRPPKYNQNQLDYAMHLLVDHSYNQVTKLTGISKSTLIRERKKRIFLEFQN